MFSCQIAQLRWLASWHVYPPTHGWNIHCFWGMLPPMSTRRPGVRLVCQQPGPLTGTQPPGPLGTNGGIKIASVLVLLLRVFQDPIIGSISQVLWRPFDTRCSWISIDHRHQRNVHTMSAREWRHCI